MSRRSAVVRRGLPPAIGVPAPADRRFRRPDVRLPRSGTLGRVSRRVLAVGVLALVVGAALGWGIRAALSSPWLVVRHITVHGVNRLTAPEVEALVGDLRQENILRADLAVYRERLQQSPWIRAATLHRELPSTVVVDITERVPLVLAHLGDRLYLVDRDGAVIDEAGPKYRDLDLPVVDGLGRPGMKPGPSVDTWRVYVVDRFLGALAAAPSLRQRISQIDVSDPHDLTVLLEGDPTVIKLGDEHFVDRLERYLALAPQLRQTLSDLVYVDVRFENLFVMPRGRVSVSSRPARTP